MPPSLRCTPRGNHASALRGKSRAAICKVLRPKPPKPGNTVTPKTPFQSLGSRTWLFFTGDYLTEVIVHAANAGSEHAHDLERERRAPLHDKRESRPIDQLELGRLLRDCGGTARRAVDHGDLSEHPARPYALENDAADDDIHFARADDVHVAAVVVLEKDRLAGLEALQRNAARHERAEIEGCFRHYRRPADTPFSVS